MKKFKRILLILMLILPPAVVALAYFYINFHFAVIFGFLAFPLMAIAVGTVIRNKMEYGCFIFVKEKPKKLDAINSGYECPFCGARFKIKRVSCPDCGKNINN